MSNKEKAKQELVEAYIECCKKRKEIESVKLPNRTLDGHNGKWRQVTLDFIEKGKEIMQKYQVDGIDFPRQEMLEIEKKYYWHNIEVQVYINTAKDKQNKGEGGYVKWFL